MSIYRKFEFYLKQWVSGPFPFSSTNLKPGQILNVGLEEAKTRQILFRTKNKYIIKERVVADLYFFQLLSQFWNQKQ